MLNKLEAKKIIIAMILKIGTKFNHCQVANQNGVCFIYSIRFVNVYVCRLVLGKNAIGAKYTNSD